MPVITPPPASLDLVAGPTDRPSRPGLGQIPFPDAPVGLNVAAVGAVVEVEHDLRLCATLGRIDVQFDLVLQISTGVSESAPWPTVEE